MSLFVGVVYKTCRHFSFQPTLVATLKDLLLDTAWKYHPLGMSCTLDLVFILVSRKCLATKGSSVEWIVLAHPIKRFEEGFCNNPKISKKIVFVRWNRHSLNFSYFYHEIQISNFFHILFKQKFCPIL